MLLLWFTISVIVWLCMLVLVIFFILDTRLAILLGKKLSFWLFPKPKLSFRYLKQGIQEFHTRYVLIKLIKLLIMLLLCDDFIIQELGCTKTYERISTDERSIVNTHSIDITAKFAVSIKETQVRLPTLYWLPKLHKRPYKARFIANSSSCATTVLYQLLTSCLTAVKKKTLD